MKNRLDNILYERALNWRQHCGLTPDWGRRQPSVLDIPPEALAVCRRTPGAYGRRLWRNGDILFPAADISCTYPLAAPDFPAGFIASVPEGNEFYNSLAEKMGGKVIRDSDELPDAEAAVIFGSSAENKHACRLAILQRVMANGIFPGKGGWSLEFPYGTTLRAVICCDESSVNEFLKHWDSKRTPRMVPGSSIPESFRNPEEVLKKICESAFYSHFI